MKKLETGLMNLKSIIPIALLLYASSLSGEPYSYNTKSNAAADTIPHELLYDLPAFTRGTIYLKDGTVDSYLFNYNCYRKEMQLLSDAGDTLQFIEPELMDSLVIDKLVYYYDKGYLLQLCKDNVYKIAIKKTIKFHQRVDSQSLTFEAPQTRTGMFNFDKVKFYPVVEYFIGDRFNHFRKANKSGFLKKFSEKKIGLREYIKENAIDFKKEEDIIKLFRYCNK